MLLGMYEDAVEEFKKSGPGGKIAIVGVFILVAGIGFYEYKKHGSGISGVSSPSTDTAGTPASGMLGSTPIIPPGYNAIFDSGGQLIGWQPGSPPTATNSSGNVPSPPVWASTGNFSGPGGDKSGQGYRFIQGTSPDYTTDPNTGETTYHRMGSATKQPTQVPSTQLTPAKKMVG